MNEEDWQKCINNLKEELPKLEEKLIDKINEIVTDLKEVDPLYLLLTLSQQELAGNLFINSESLMDEDSIFLGYAIMYLQSIIVSNSNLGILEDNKEYEVACDTIIKNTCDMLKLYQKYYIGIKYMSSSDLVEDKDSLCLKMYLELMNIVTGNRYQCFHKKYFEILMSGQNDLIYNTYGITAEELILGLENYNKFISFGLQEAKEIFEKSFEKFQESGYKNPEKFRDELHKCDVVNRAYRILFGDGLFDFGEVSKFPRKLLDDLSYGVGEEKDFASDPNPFFPSKILPINKRPLLKLKDTYYCFWSRVLYDKFYRIIYKSITKDHIALKEQWNKNQKETTETNILKLICEKLDFKNYYCNNYYYKKIGKNEQRIENDAIILYENKIIILEIKAGALSNSSLAEDFESFENNFNEIFNKGITQGERLIDLISENDVTVYDENDNIKFIIPKTENSNIFVMNVTVDDMNEIAAQFETTKYATYSRTHNCICISLSDLLVYCEYFDDKITFFHFLSKRCKSLTTDKIRLSDELDHLGLYISHNDYTMYADGFSSDIINWSGYRTALDEYFCKKHAYDDLEKPKQSLPVYINKIVEFLNLNHSRYINTVDIASHFLDLSIDAKIELNEIIESSLNNKTSQILFLKGEEVNYSIIVNKRKNFLNKKSIDNHIYATMRAANESNRISFNLIFEEIELFDLLYEEYDIRNLDEKEIPEIDALKDIIIDNRIKKFKGKIGRNSLCSCGSGKKYKKCCLNKKTTK